MMSSNRSVQPNEARLSEGYVALGGGPSCVYGSSKFRSVAISAVIFCLSVSLIPVYNKKVFSGSANIDKFPYPVATSFLQLSFVSLVLGLGDSLAFLLCPRRAEWSPSWLFGPRFWYKLRHASPAGLCFGLKFAFTNWGLLLVPTATHMLLQSTDLLWTVGCAWLLVGERVGAQEVSAILLTTLGTVLISFDAAAFVSAPLIPLLVNVLTPLPLALSVAALRRGVKELMRPDNLVGGMLAVEVTAIKLAVSSLTCLAAACLLEGGSLGLSKRTGLREGHGEPWWEALAAYPGRGVALVLLGAVLILVFQVNITWLARLTSAVTVGMLASVKVVPQWLVFCLMGLQGPTSPAFAVGVALVLLAGLLYLEGKAGICEQVCMRYPTCGRACGKPSPATGVRAACLAGASVAPV